MKLTHIRLLVDDFPASFRFYRDVMGLEATWGNENDVYADFEAGGAALALFSRSLMEEAVGRPAGADSGRTVIVFAVDDVDAEFARLERAGAVTVSPPVDRSEWGIRAGHIADPDSNLIEIYQSLRTEASNAG